MGFNDVLNLPIYTFWEMSKNTNRIRAIEDKRMFSCIQNMLAENPQHYIDNLDREIGDIITFKPTFDVSGFKRLRAIMGV